MLRIRDTLAGDRITFHYVQSHLDIGEFKQWVLDHRVLGIDTESTGLNCYHPLWRLRTVQCGDAYNSYVVPARFKKLIAWLMHVPQIKWIGHNGPHDMRCIDQHLGYETGVTCVGETYIPAHHLDSRNQREGGVNHGLKEQSIARLDRNAGKWEVALKNEFKKIRVDIPGAVYKSGKNKGQQKTRAARLSEGWALIDPQNRAYIAYAAADPLLTYRLYAKLQPTVERYHKLYRFDLEVQNAVDRLTRRAIRLDVPYTERLSRAYERRAARAMETAKGHGCGNIHSGPQVARVLVEYGVQLTERTPTGQYKVDDKVIRALLADDRTDSSAKAFLKSVLLAKQLLKRRTAYTEKMLAEVDAEGRVHPSIRAMGARTTRMSVSDPPLQQLPTKNRSADNEN